MSQESTLSEPPNSQSTRGGTPAPAPTSEWTIWSRGINKGGDWHCTHRFKDDTETYHYVNKDGTHYMKHRDGSTTFVPREGTYILQKGHDQKSTIPAPTMEERIQEHEEIKKEYRQYLANPVKYWNGARTARPRHYASWLFPTCDCGDHFSAYDDGYPQWESEYEHDYEEDYEMYAGEYEYEGYGRNSEDEEEDDSEDDRRSPSPDECKPTTERGDDNAVIRMPDGAHPSAIEEFKADVKQEADKEVTLSGPVIMRLTPEKEGNPASPTPNAVPESGATGSGKITSRAGSGIGPDLETEAKRILRSHRSKPY